MMDTMTERALADLVRRVWNDGQVSYREMEARAKRRGHSISHSQLADYAKDTVRKPPTIEQTEALAAALDMGYEQVRAAIFEQFYGYVPRELRSRKGSRIAAALPPDLSAADEAEIAHIVEAWLSARTRRRNDSDNS